MPRKDSKLKDLIIDNLEDGAIAIDKNGALKIINKQARVALDILDEDVIGKKIWDIVDNSEFNKALLLAVRELDFHFLDKLLVLDNNRPFQVKITQVMTPDDKILGATAIMRDLSHFAKLETALNSYVTNVSHELKAPLTAIKGYIETLLDESLYQNPEINKKFLQIINAETNRMTRLIMNMLDINSSSGSEVPIVMKAISVTKILAEAIALFKNVAEQKNIELVVNLPENMVPVAANSDKLKQIFINVIDNAVKYTGIKKHGSITIDAIESGKNIKVTISDTGIGIDEKYIDKIFDRFYRVQDGDALQLGGTGLGLSITKTLLEKMSGSIEVKSKLGEGSKFTITLPMAT